MRRRPEIDPQAFYLAPPTSAYMGELSAYLVVVLAVSHVATDLGGWPSWLAWAPTVALLYWEVEKARSALAHLALAWNTKLQGKPPTLPTDSP